MRTWRSDLRKQVDTFGLFDHEFFSLIEEKPQTLKIWIGQDYAVSKSFPGIIAKIISEIKNQRVQINLCENLWDELGEGKVSSAHSSLLNNVAFSLGVEVETQILHTRTIEWIEVHRKLAEEDSIAALGAFCYASEYLSVKELERIKQAIEKHFPKASTKYFDVSTTQDWVHTKKVEDCIEQLSFVRDWLPRTEKGLKVGMKLRSNFYDGVIAMMASSS